MASSTYDPFGQPGVTDPNWETNNFDPTQVWPRDPYTQSPWPAPTAMGDQSSQPPGSGDNFGNIPWNQVFDTSVQNRALDQQQQYLNYMLNQYMPGQQQLQGNYFNWMSGYQNQMLQNQTNLGNYQADWAGINDAASLSGEYNGAPTLQAQQLMNNYALQQGNQSLTARGQDLSYSGMLGNLASSALGDQTQYGMGAQNLAGSYGQDAVNLAGIQAQLAQSPLVAWYTARGLPPPASAVMNQQAPDLGSTLQTLNQYGSGPPQSFEQLQAATPQFQGLGQFTPPQMSWTFQNSAPPVPYLPITGGSGSTYTAPSSPQPINFTRPTGGTYQSVQGGPIGWG